MPKKKQRDILPRLSDFPVKSADIRGYFLEAVAVGAMAQQPSPAGLVYAKVGRFAVPPLVSRPNFYPGFGKMSR
jgi:hypothetical protein